MKKKGGRRDIHLQMWCVCLHTCPFFSSLNWLHPQVGVRFLHQKFLVALAPWPPRSPFGEETGCLLNILLLRTTMYVKVGFRAPLFFPPPARVRDSSRGG